MAAPVWRYLSEFSWFQTTWRLAFVCPEQLKIVWILDALNIREHVHIRFDGVQHPLTAAHHALTTASPRTKNNGICILQKSKWVTVYHFVANLES